MAKMDSVTDKEERKIMKMFYDWDNERKVMLEMQKCQRNWDYDKFDALHPELIKQAVNELIWTATNSPTKQHEGYFDVYYTYDRKVIEEISSQMNVNKSYQISAGNGGEEGVG